ncbi:uncharacterized protein B0T15DRAFT_286612 [Chaetomium strumarium]|uniref:Secreted protein n=1 Tax=Chaetomium strumarium TaxID=1170767 RepID=A0AAJ0GL31_9PEZI|nr:hypothetical protein B0T15DRAFT_286612 [Chaetomium strumarium]
MEACVICGMLVAFLHHRRMALLLCAVDVMALPGTGDVVNLFRAAHLSIPIEMSCGLGPLLSCIVPRGFSYCVPSLRPSCTPEHTTEFLAPWKGLGCCQSGH